MQDSEHAMMPLAKTQRPEPQGAGMLAGVDLGGTKIETCVFDAAFQVVARQRVDTPTGSYDAMLNALTAQLRWADTVAAGCPIGVGTPGLIHPQTGVMLTANLPATGHPLATDLSRAFGRQVAVINDSRAFVLAEAQVGAARGYTNVAGLVIGTGVAGGQVINGKVLADLNGQHGEYGHLPLSATTVARHDLRLLPCGCGLTGCFETYLSGPGLMRLAKLKTGQKADTRRIMGDPIFAAVVDVWVDIAADLIAILNCTIDPQVIVLGGGMGGLPDLPTRIARAMPPKMLGGTVLPLIVTAQGSDASGARGAAMFAKAVAG